MTYLQRSFKPIPVLPFLDTTSPTYVKTGWIHGPRSMSNVYCHQDEDTTYFLIDDNLYEIPTSVFTEHVLEVILEDILNIKKGLNAET